MKRVGRSVAFILFVGCVVCATTPGLAWSTTTRAKATTVAGEWTGTWKRTSPPPTTGTMTFTLTQHGAKLSGTVQVVGSACLTTNKVHGTVNGKKVTVAVSEATVTAKYTGAVSGSTMSGSLAVTCSGLKGVGTFSLSRT